jgi:predicted transcriptional regulator
MATNLRLGPETEIALRKAAQSSGRSQQEIIRQAVDRFLGLGSGGDDLADLIARGVVIPPREPLRHASARLKLPPGVTSLDLLDREDRF